MCDDWIVTDRVVASHSAWAEKGHYLFASPVWAEQLKSLGATPLYAWSDHRQTGLVIPVFRRMSFRIGFLGFPVTGEAVDQMDPKEADALVWSILRQGRLSLIRVTRGNQRSPVGPIDSARPDVWIDDFEGWAEGGKRLRRDLTFAKRAVSDFKIYDGVVAPDQCFALYLATVGAHGGTAKYSVDYFRQLASLAQGASSVTAHSVLDEKGDTRAFAVTGRHGNWGYYLHAAADGAARRMGVGDLLLSRLVNHAREQGCTRFSFMASPWEQPGLIKFKQKWGTDRGLATTRDVGRGIAAIGLKTFTAWQSRHDRREALNWMRSK